MSKKLVIASTTPQEIEKLTWIADDYFDSVVTQSRTIDTEQTGKDFEQDAALKAESVSQYYGCYAIASQGGSSPDSDGKSEEADTVRKAVAIAWNGRLAFSSEVQGDKSSVWDRLKDEVDWFVTGKH